MSEEKKAAEALAMRFHETYERLAPGFGYETRHESAKPWDEVPNRNKRLMTAVCAEILAASPPIAPPLERGAAERKPLSDAENVRRAIVALKDARTETTGATLAELFGIDTDRLAALVAPRVEPATDDAQNWWNWWKHQAAAPRVETEGDAADDVAAKERSEDLEHFVEWVMSIGRDTNINAERFRHYAIRRAEVLSSRPPVDPKEGT